MLPVLRRMVTYKFFPFCWTVLIIVLLCLPGSYVPGNGLFGMPHLDKVVHFFLFGFNVLFWGWHYNVRAAVARSARNKYFLIMLWSVALGVALEFVQMTVIPRRSFDSWDIVADAAGAIVAWMWLLRT